MEGTSPIASKQLAERCPEWFVNSTKFLDGMAKAMDVDQRVINDFEAGED